MNKKIIAIFSILFLLASTKISLAADVSFGNPLGVGTVQDLISVMIEHLQTILALIAILFMVISGIIYITAGGLSDKITTAKNMWVGSLIGLVLVLFAPTFLKEAMNALLPKDADNNPIIPTDINQTLTLTTMITNVLSALLSIIGILAIISLVVSGFVYIFSFGDSSRADKAKDMIKWSIFGLALAGISVIVVRQIASFF